MLLKHVREKFLPAKRDEPIKPTAPANAPATAPAETSGEPITPAIIEAYPAGLRLVETHPNLNESANRRRRVSIGASQLRLTLMPYIDDRTGETAEMRNAYRQMMRDDAVKAALMSKVLAVASLDLSVEPDNEDSPREREVAEFVKWAIQNVQGGFSRLAHNLILHKLIDGYSLSQIVPYVIPEGKYANKIGIRQIKPKPPNTYNFGLDEFGDVEKVIGQGLNAGEVYDPELFVINSHMPLYENPIGMSDLRAAYRLFYIKDLAWKLRAIFLEKYAIGSLVGKYTNEDDKPKIEDALEAYRAATYLVVPNDVSVEAVNIAQKGAADYESAIRDLNHGIFLAITGAILQALEGSSTGARSIGEVHKSTAELLVWALAEDLCNDLNTQVVPLLVKLNFVGINNPPTVTLGGVNDAELESALKIDLGLASMGLELSQKELRKRYRRGSPVDDADRLTPQQAQQFLGQGQPGGSASADFFYQGQAEKFIDEPADPLNRLTETAIDEGVALLEKLFGDAIKRVARGESRQLLNADELKTLRDLFAKVLATGELLGRATVRNQLNANQRGLKFADEPPDLSAKRFLTLNEGGPIPLLPPEKALEYFSSLVPGVTGDPGYFGDTIRRKAFTLAVTTNETVLKAVQKVITDSLATGTGSASDIADILSSAGISSRNPQYAEMVFRTNMMTSYMQGHEQERRDPEVVEFFPVWSWDTIMDGRERPTHGARNGKYYPAHVSFQEVRGDPDPAEICNCRCISRAIGLEDWQALQAAGAQMETSW